MTTRPRRLSPPELMSPAGGIEQLRAAVEAGADAVYFGLSGFNARAKAMAFTAETLPEVVSELHERGVLGFVAVNTLVFDDELGRLESQIAGIALAGADAVIVQDLGVVRLVREVAPDLPVHASTQMTVTSAPAAELARRLGASRVVLARELSLSDIAAVAAGTGVELETFVHGALCVSYSGQCFSSEAWGGRSANRGACAQACRMPYGLVVDGIERDLGPYRYLLSPRDLYALHQVPDLIRAGVDCLKIEGRYKSAEYVAATTAAYRKAIDDAWANRPLSVSPAEELDLEGVYSRGLEPAFISGTDHQRVVDGRSPRHRGVQVGVVLGAGPAGVRVRLDGPEVCPGDGLVFDAAGWRSPQEREEGGAVFELVASGERLASAGGGREVELRFANGQLDPGRVRPGDLVWRTLDPAIERRLRVYTRAADPVARRPLRWRASGRAGEPLVLVARDEGGREVEARSQLSLQPAGRRPMTADSLEAELGRLGDTPFSMAGLDFAVSGEVFLPLSALSRLRRTVLDDLLAWRREPEPRVVRPGRLGAMRPAPEPAMAGEAELSVLVRGPEQLEATLEARPDEIVLDYLELYGLRPSVERVRAAGLRAVVAGPRVLKPAEERIHRFLLSLGADAILVRSLGLLKSLIEASDRPALHGDFSLNAANAVSARTLLDLGLERLAPTHDLNAEQVARLALDLGPDRLEVILHHHLPVFHTEHCVFCRFLSSGTDHSNCGHPCESHRLTLRDEKGHQHPVLADVGCRNTVFNDQAQTGAAHLGAWRAAGLRRFRLEFVHETAEQVQGTLGAYRRALAGELTAAGLERELARFSPTGLTEGSLVVPARDFERLPQLL